MYLIDTAYNLVLHISNKSQRGKITPLDFNLFAAQSLNKLYNDLLSDYRLLINKQNRYFTGQGLANEAKFTSQQLEYYVEKSPLLDIAERSIDLSENMSFVINISAQDGAVFEKSDPLYFDVILNHRYNSSSCRTAYCRYGNRVAFSSDVEKIRITYLRNPATPKWTYSTVGGVELFNPDAPDFAELDIHPSLLSRTVVEICSLAGINIREPEITQMMEQQKANEIQKNNTA
jgi:hypothetical protein